ncbi:MAG: peptide chain release factor 2 [Limnochordia bacterium]
MIWDIEREEVQEKLAEVARQLEEMRAYLDLDQKRSQLAQLEGEMARPGFWDDQEQARKVIAQVKHLKDRLTDWDELYGRYEDVAVLLELVDEEPEEELCQELKAETNKLVRQAERVELATLLSGPYDANNALLSIHPGAGGTESQDWASMLVRMYTRWAEEQGMELEVLDFLPGDEAGVKSATLLVKGINAYGYLRAEKGVHRLVRISPFDSSGRRHTSFASVDVIPEIDDDVDVDLNPNDLKIDTYRASGAGGQHVNKTSSAVRITHLPTGIVVQCQNDRSQHKNRDTAMRLLRSRLAEMKREELQEKMDELRGEQGEIAWGNQIRSYVFCPYTMVKDHRTDVEVGNVQAVMDGYLDPFIEAYLRQSLQGGRKGPGRS